MEQIKIKQLEKEYAIVVPCKTTCKVCGTQVNQKDKCLCRPHLCYRCCNCGLDCDACNCSVKSK